MPSKKKSRALDSFLANFLDEIFLTKKKEANTIGPNYSHLLQRPAHFSLISLTLLTCALMRNTVLFSSIPLISISVQLLRFPPTDLGNLHLPPPIFPKTPFGFQNHSFGIPFVHPLQGIGSPSAVLLRESSSLFSVISVRPVVLLLVLFSHPFNLDEI